LLARGFGRLRVALLKYSNKFEVRTPSIAIAVRGTDFSILASPTLTRIEVFKGVVQVRALEGTQTVEVHAGESCEALKDGGIQPVPCAGRSTPREIHGVQMSRQTKWRSLIFLLVFWTLPVHAEYCVDWVVLRATPVPAVRVTAGHPSQSAIPT